MWFVDMERWSAAGFAVQKWKWPTDYIRPLSIALENRQVEIDRQKANFAHMHLVTLRFDGSMEPRDTTPSEIKGKLYLAEAGDIVYSKIDVRNGAIGIVPETIPLAAFTSEFPIYRIRENIALAEYVTLLFRTQFFRQTINAMISGASGRKRVQPSQLMDVEIPLPPLGVQRTIVKKWRDARLASVEALALAEQIEKDAGREFLHGLGLVAPDEIKPRKAFAVQWSEFERWGVDMCRNTKNRSLVFMYPTLKIKEICRIGSGGTPSRKVAAYYDGGHIPWVKTTEVRNEIIFETEEKVTPSALENSSAKLYPAGSLIIAMYGQGATRGRTAKLGIEAATNQACCVLSNFDSRIETDFLWFYLMGEYDRIRALASGNNQPNLNAEMIANYEVPLPPIKIQRDLMNVITKARQQAATARQKAETLKTRSAEEIEAAILGGLPN
ncbi:restriction endonuclease subunit S [Methylomicrobium sp. Wu6]|uniref:restriction endonuclease subunit S n=1 Tax=Methylomicrobium sp. Wu6 TaxID=3107928 RepID=UPI002DD6B3CC|nr:restriction endonuclease subunit S [Methylomicrobium sp. Wu6]MEC4747227.1 restriction endonuclease subunit S [Methylomicrobium sp. Wu6]